jgi:hypothetical protein
MTDAFSENFAAMQARATAVVEQRKSSIETDPVYMAACAAPWKVEQCQWERTSCAGRQTWAVTREIASCHGHRTVSPNDARVDVDPDDGRLRVPCPRYETAQCIGTLMEPWAQMENWFVEAGIPRRYRWARPERIQRVREYWRYVENMKHELQAGNGLILFGGVGVGKTMALSYLAQEARKYVREARFVFAPVLFNVLIQSGSTRDDAGTEAQARLAEFTRCDLLLLDDWGVEYAGSDWAVSRFEELVERRHSRLLATVISTNLDPEVLAKSSRWARVVDRWHETCSPVIFTGTSQRGHR